MPALSPRDAIDCTTISGKLDLHASRTFKETPVTFNLIKSVGKRDRPVPRGTRHRLFRVRRYSDASQTLTGVITLVLIVVSIHHSGKKIVQIRGEARMDCPIVPEIRRGIPGVTHTHLTRSAQKRTHTQQVLPVSERLDSRIYDQRHQYIDGVFKIELFWTIPCSQRLDTVFRVGKIINAIFKIDLIRE